MRAISLSGIVCGVTRIFRTRTFDRWMKKAGLTDQALRLAVVEMTRGLIDADLGGGVMKKRVALPGRGKRGGARTIVATRFGKYWFFLYGFAKNERGTIGKDELRALQELARELLNFTDRQIGKALSSNEIFEVIYGNEETQEPDS